MKPYLVTRDGVTLPQDGVAVCNSMASDLIAASCAGVNLTDTHDERAVIQWLFDAGWPYRDIRKNLDDALSLAKQWLVTNEMVAP